MLGRYLKAHVPLNRWKRSESSRFHAVESGWGGGHIVGASKQRVLVKDTEVVEMSRNDHCSGSLRVGENRGRTAVRRCNNNVLNSNRYLLFI